MKLEEFYQLVDGIIDGIEAGTLEGKEVKAKTKIKTLEDTIIRSTEVEIGEDGEEIIPVVGKVGKKLVIVTPSDGTKPIVYGSISAAARSVGLTPTTIKSRCDKKKIDGKGQLWSYKEEVNKD